MPAFTANVPCPCGSASHYGNCCGQYHSGQRSAETAEKLMRSRYSAFVLRDGNYLLATLAQEQRDGFDAPSIANDQTRWLGLEIVDCAAGGVLDQTGKVEFIARFIENGQTLALHERSNFERRDGKWFYVNGVFPDADGQSSKDAFALVPSKVGRNDPCPCGSGKKHKKCCR